MDYVTVRDMTSQKISSAICSWWCSTPTFNRRDFGDAPARFGLVLEAPGPFLRSLPP
jgi:hypothetical protein